MILKTLSVQNANKQSLEIEIKRVKELMERIESNYSGLNGTTYSPAPVFSSAGKPDDKMFKLVNKLAFEDFEDKQMNLRSYYNTLVKELNIVNESIKATESILGTLTGREYELYYEIKVNGLNKTRAIEKIARKYELEERTIWKYTYSKIKKYL